MRTCDFGLQRGSSPKLGVNLKPYPCEDQEDIGANSIVLLNLGEPTPFLRVKRLGKTKKFPNEVYEALLASLSFQGLLDLSIQPNEIFRQSFQKNAFCQNRDEIIAHMDSPKQLKVLNGS